MSRIPASAGVVLVGLLPVCAAALGLGEVQSRSYLNQPFDAEIPIRSDAPGELSGLSVTLASSEVFEQYGLPRPAFLGDLVFNVVSTGQGGVLRITSAAPIVEPFVTLLLEVRWPQGRLLREYTVLLDPPSFAGGDTAERVAPAARTTGTAEPSRPAAAAAVSPQPPGVRPDTHDVARNETLWGIAERYRSGADINQMMLAIYRANPDAFAGNINRLNAGASLRIPGEADVAAIGRGTAVAEVRRQTDEWAGAAPTAGAARLELVPPTEPTMRAPDATSASASAQAGTAASSSDETRRLLAVKDAELQALRQRVAELERQGGEEAAVEDLAPAPAITDESAGTESPAESPTAALTETPPAAEAPVQSARETAPPRKEAKPTQDAPAAGGLVETILGLLTKVEFWLALAAAIVAALLFRRRGAAGDDEPKWRPTPRRGDLEAGAAAATGANIVVEETRRSSTTGGLERRPAPRGDQELPLERTISTEGPINLDQSDPLAEADFHMAYGLYDQAADLLGAAIGREPRRRDLQMKLMDVHFVWENRDGFLKEARALRERIGNDLDADWKRVLIMGKQLCPDEALFAGATGAVAADMDLALTADGAGTVDLPFIESGDAGLDFDLGQEAESSAPTQVAQHQWSAARTQEIPTIEAPGLDASPTMETPTIESPAYGSTTMETPTIEAPMNERTLETPTLRSRTQDGARTANMALPGATDQTVDQTAEIDLEDLAIDLSGLDEAAQDMATGLQKSINDPDDADDAFIDLDLSGSDLDSVADDEGSDLDSITRAMGRGNNASADTAEQFALGDGADTRSGPGLGRSGIDFDLGAEENAGDLTSTGLRAIRDRRPEDPTMTEVGTKLDLARAYVDMGDPDGARSILNEVLEEGDPSQRQEARQLLDMLPS